MSDNLKNLGIIRLKLTQARVRSMQPLSRKEKTRVFDTEETGFHLVIYPSGLKSFVIDYRTREGRRRQMVLGRFCNTFGVEAARAEAKKVLVAVHDGLDPLAQRRMVKETAKASLTLADYWEKHFLLDASARWKPSTKKLQVYLWETMIARSLGKIRLDSLTSGKVADWHRSNREAPTQANTALRLLRSIFNHAIREEVIPGPSPIARVKFYPEKPRQRFLSSEEFHALWLAIAEEEARGGKKSVKRIGKAVKGKRGGKGLFEAQSRGISPHAAALFRLLILTGSRVGEIMLARWEWIRWSEKVLSLPDSKTGAKRIPLSQAALAEIGRLQKFRTVGNPYLIEGLNPGQHLVNPAAPWDRVKRTAFEIFNRRRREADLQELGEDCFANVRIHDLRHSFASVAVASGLGLPIVGKALGHAQARTTERYAHLAEAPILEAVDLVSARILEAATGGGAVVEDIIPKAQGEK